jgi:ABC-type transporter Mla MlaB component
MLKISKLNGTENATTLQVEGRLTGAWVEELRRQCDQTLTQTQMLTIDCRGVSFSDVNGIALMRELRAKNVSFTNCSPFLQFQMNQEPAF